MNSKNEVKEPYSVTRESNNKETFFRYCLQTGLVRYDYEDNSAVVFNIHKKEISILDCNNNIISTCNPTSKYDLNLLQKANEMFIRIYYRQ